MEVFGETFSTLKYIEASLVEEGSFGNVCDKEPFRKVKFACNYDDGALKLIPEDDPNFRKFDVEFADMVLKLCQNDAARGKRS